MEEVKVFYSWQSDLEDKTHRYLIRGCINQALKQLSTSDRVFLLDESTANVPGCPDIPNTIINKIDSAAIFIADLTPITKYKNKFLPNPNVLLEFGYALKTLTSDNVLSVIDEDYVDNINDLPFDISHRDHTFYNSSDKEPGQKLFQKLKFKLNCIIKHKTFLQRISFIQDNAKRDFEIISNVLLDCNFDALDNFFEMALCDQMGQDILIYWEGFYRKIDSSIFILDNEELENEFRNLRENIGNFLNSIEDANFNSESHIYHIKKFYSNLSREQIYNFIKAAKLNSKKIAELLHSAFPQLSLAESNKKAFRENSQYIL